MRQVDNFKVGRLGLERSWGWGSNERDEYGKSPAIDPGVWIK
jgi:hypothetical protein